MTRVGLVDCVTTMTVGLAIITMTANCAIITEKMAGILTSFQLVLVRWAWALVRNYYMWG